MAIPNLWRRSRILRSLGFIIGTRISVSEQSFKAKVVAQAFGSSDTDSHRR